MLNKHFLNAAIILVLAIFSGCETVKGVASGAGHGVNQDYKNTEKFVKELGPRIEYVDQWIQKNMW